MCSVQLIIWPIECLWHRSKRPLSVLIKLLEGKLGHKWCRMWPCTRDTGEAKDRHLPLWLFNSASSSDSSVIKLALLIALMLHRFPSCLTCARCETLMKNSTFLMRRKACGTSLYMHACIILARGAVFFHYLNMRTAANISHLASRSVERNPRRIGLCTEWSNLLCIPCVQCVQCAKCSVYS